MTTTVDEYDGNSLAQALMGSGKLSLREAVAIANNLDGEQVIILDKAQAGGTQFDLTRNNPIESFNTNDLDITTDMIIIGVGSNITIQGAFVAPLVKTDTRIFDVDGAHLSLNNLTVTGGETKADGGGIQVIYDSRVLMVVGFIIKIQ